MEQCYRAVTTFTSINFILLCVCVSGYVLVFFFFQAEDGIRDYKVTGVQTCALPILSGHLWAAALCASSRIARGSAFRNRRMFAACVDRTLSALSEISYYLDMGYAMGLISKEDHQEIESLGGRALFYSMKLVMSLAGDMTSFME